MKQYGVGRPAVREALLSLSRMGLIAVRHGRRATALQPTVASVVAQLAELAHVLVAAAPEVLDDLKEARWHFEIAAVRLASQRASEADIESLRAAAEAHGAAALSARFRADAEFHRRIAAATGNALFEEMSQVIFALLERYYTGWFRAKAQRRAAAEDHIRIQERIAAHDADGAVRAMARHLERVLTRYSASADRRRGDRRKLSE